MMHSATPITNIPSDEVSTMIRNRVEPKVLPKVREQHYPGIFGDFDDVVDAAIAHHEAIKSETHVELARFFRHLKELVDREKFAKMQEFQLSEEKLDLEADLVKYIDPVTWFVSKVRLALQIGLDKREPMRILDIGTGPAHWPTVAQFYGHQVIGTELPLRATGQLEDGHLYDSLGDIYHVRRVPMMIKPLTPLPKFEHRFDMVTAFLAAFNMDLQRNPWSIEMWDFFFTDLRRNVLTERGEVFMSLTHFKTPPEVWNYLKRLAVFANDGNKVIHISDLSKFA